MSKITENKLAQNSEDAPKRRENRQHRRDFIKTLNHIDENEIAF